LRRPAAFLHRLRQVRIPEGPVRLRPEMLIGRELPALPGPLDWCQIGLQGNGWRAEEPQEYAWKRDYIEPFMAALQHLYGSSS
jgi:hypothetical protein